MIALNRMAARDRPRQPLPEFTLNEIVGRAFGGDIEAQRLMGMMYDPAFDEAPGFTKDRTTAQNFYQKAASQGDVRAAGLLGSMLVAGDNPTPDRDAGMQWLETAATGGDPASALRLAELVVERQPDAAGRAKAVPFLKIAAADSSTSGMANAWLRYIGQPAVQ
jgi:TPR repeat protein